MAKYYLSFLFFIVMAITLGLPVYAQEGPPDEQRQQRLEKLEGRLQDIYHQIEALKKEATDNPPAEAKEKLEVLVKEAKELEEKIQDLQGRFRPEGPSDESEGDRPQDNVREEIHRKRQELRKLEQRIGSAAEEEREALEEQRGRLLEEIEALQKKMSGAHKEGENQPRKMGKRLEEWMARKDRKSTELDNPAIRERLEQLKAQMPEKFQKLMELRERNPEQFRQMLEKLRHEKIGPQDPEMHEFMQKQRKLDEKAKKLVHAIQKAEGQEREKQIAELRNLLNEIFDLRQQMKEREIQKLAEKLEQLKQGAAQRKENKAIIVDQQLKKMLGEDPW